jgi:hypothetical protein
MLLTGMSLSAHFSQALPENRREQAGLGSQKPFEGTVLKGVLKLPNEVTLGEISS